MIKLLPLTLDSRDIVKPYFKNITNSMYNFTTALIWNGEKYAKYSETEGCLSIFYEFPKTPVFASYPIGSGNKKEAVIAVCEYLKSKGVTPVMRNLSADMKEELSALFPDKFNFVPDRNSFDYVYETKRLIDLGGKDLHTKRNHYNYFVKNNNYEYAEMTPSDVLSCKELFDKWMEKKEQTKWILSSRAATFMALDNLKALGLTGGMIKIDGEICAFSVGEKVSDDMALIHLEVASPDVRGAFNAINREFCANAWKDCTYVNREEDMGLSGLRKAKEAYRPAFLLEKFHAIMKHSIF